ncbi:protein of unknown function [Tistlia consotensis]|uniref:DUF4396 domain-containing protein n=1 Tax=Tistlia consotensis USBA 355 TaxID=560819 RepID=A0A1Y6BHN4_9PROT|nr:DUF4396 domain-containing protein [Tistlia consotensis]SMF12241.1 protein of unknown function [Tistlia consotensis USBA 355]SNR51235.1 protein of unknown function [Tistlia consotensis]
MIPDWLHLLSIAALGLGLLCAAAVLVDVLRHPQHMWIMGVVWPVVALFGTAIALWGYVAYGRLSTHRKMRRALQRDETPPNKAGTPFWIMVAKGTSHCGAGCTLGDICAEWLAFALPAVAVWLGWQSLFQEKMFAVWILDFLFAYGFGVAFQYFTIAPMRGLGLWAGLAQAVKADTLSLTAWQVGMYGFMAVANFWIFRDLLGATLEVASPEFWFMMQIAMLFGFATAYPVNWWLLRAGIKEEM